MFIKISISENDLPSMRFEYRDSPYVLAYPFKGHIYYINIMPSLLGEMSVLLANLDLACLASNKRIGSPGSWGRIGSLCSPPLASFLPSPGSALDQTYIYTPYRTFLSVGKFVFCGFKPFPCYICPPHIFC